MTHPDVHDGPQGSCVEWSPHPEKQEFTVTTWKGYRPSTGEASIVRRVTFMVDEERKTLTPVNAAIKFPYNTWKEFITPSKGMTNTIARKARTTVAEWSGSGEKYWRIV